MTPKTKKVYFYKVKVIGEVSMSHMLLTKENHNAIHYEGKSLELKHIVELNDLITGLFISTKRNGIPPKHKVDTDDYSAVELEDGQGLAYPNMMLYSKKFEVMLLEYNQYGAKPKDVIKYLVENFSGSSDEGGVSVELVDVLSHDAWRRILDFKSLKSVNFRVAKPTALLEDDSNSGPLKDYAELAKSSNATDSMEITLKSEEVTGGLNKKVVESFINQLIRMKNRIAFASNPMRFNATGMKESEDGSERLEPAEVNLFKDRLKGIFKLDEPPVHNSVQTHERRTSIVDIFNYQKSELSKVIKPSE